MQLDLAGVPVVITGAASGIGRACALAFAAEGARVGVIDRSPVDLPGIVSAVADVTDEPALASAVVAIIYHRRTTK